MTVGVGLVGTGGHQLTTSDVTDAGGVVLGVVEADSPSIPAEVEALAHTADLRLVSVCLAPRSLQVAAAIVALEVGRDVLIERPAATSLHDLERLRRAALLGGGTLWERATIPFEQPYRRARELVDAGALGRVVLVTAHKSYPWADWRDPNEAVQGGLVLQAATYGLDGVVHVAGQRIVGLRLVDTTAGEPRGSDLRMAAVLSVALESGAVASVVADYLNPGGTWSRDQLLVVGTAGRLSVDATAGTIEITDAHGTRTETPPPAPGLATALITALAEGSPTSPPAESTLLSTEWALRALVNGRRSFTKGTWPQ